MTFTSIQPMNYGVLKQELSNGSTIISQKNRLFYAGASYSDDNSKKIYYSKPEGEYFVDQRRKYCIIFLVLMRYHDTKYNIYSIGASGRGLVINGCCLMATRFYELVYLFKDISESHHTDIKQGKKSKQKTL